MAIDLDTLRSRWNEILDLIEREDRIAWLAFFDARLARLEGNHLTLDFNDARKFSGAHEYSPVREKHIALLEKKILEVTHEVIKVSE